MLPSSITASGASGSGSKVAGLNGTYDLASGTDGGGNQYYTKEGGGYYAYFVPADGNHWWVSDTLDSTGNGYYKVGSADSVPTGSGWTPAGNPVWWAGGGLTVGASAPAAPAAPTFGSVWVDAIAVNAPALSGGATSYALQDSPDGTTWTLIGSVTPSSVYKAFPNVAPPTGSPVFFRFVATNSAGSTNGAAASQTLGTLVATVSPTSSSQAFSASPSTVTATVSALAGGGLNTASSINAPTVSGGGPSAALTGAGVSGGSLAYTAASGTAQAVGLTISVPASLAAGIYSISVPVTNDGVSLSPAIYTLTITAAPPSAPGAPTLAATGQTTVAVTMPGLPSGASSLSLQRSPDNATWATIASGLAGGASYGDTGLTAATTYYYRAVAVGSGGSTSGPSASVTTNSPPPLPSAPPAPTFGTPTTTTVPINVCALTAGSASLNIQRSPDNAAWATVGTGVTPSAVATDTGRAASTVYYYRFAAVGPGGTTYGPSASVMTASPDTTPPAFSSASVNAAGTTLTVNWAEAGSPPVAGTAGLAFAASGAAVALSGVSTSGLVTTGTPARVVDAAEVCTLAYAPGNFADSAAAPNAMLAFGPQAVTNNSTVVPALATPVITSPAAAATVSGLLAVTATASGGVGGVQRVELYVNGNLVDTQYAPTSGTTYTLSWDTTPSGNGAYSLQVKAYDHYAPTPQSASSAAVSVTAANAGVLGTEYLFLAPQTPAPGKTVLMVLPTLDVVPTADSRQRREIFVGVNAPGTSTNFEADYPPVPLNADYVLPAPGPTYRLAVKLAAPYTLSPVTFTAQVVKIVPLGTDGAACVVWTADGKLWSFNALAVPTLLLDTATVLTGGEALNDVCWFAGRLYLAIGGGAAPVATRLYVLDLLAGDEPYSIYQFATPVTALCATATSLYAGTSGGAVHSLSAGGALVKVCGKATANLPAGVARLFPLALSAANTTPGVAVVLTDGTVWDVDGTAAYGATEIFLPDSHSNQVNAGAVVAGTRFLGTGPDGNLWNLPPASGSAYAVAYPFPHAVNALAPFAGTLYAGLASDNRLYGKALSPGAHALAYGAVTDPLDASVSAITALCPLTPATGGPVLVIGCTGTGTTLYRFTAPAASANAVFGKAIAHPGAVVRQFA